MLERYENIRAVGDAKFGRVYSGVETATGKAVFIKRIPVRRLVNGIAPKLLARIRSLPRKPSTAKRDYVYFSHNGPFLAAGDGEEDAIAQEGEDAIVICFPRAVYEASQVLRSMETSLLTWTPISLDEVSHALSLFGEEIYAAEEEEQQEQDQPTVRTDRPEGEPGRRPFSQQGHREHMEVPRLSLGGIRHADGQRSAPPPKHTNGSGSARSGGGSGEALAGSNASTPRSNASSARGSGSRRSRIPRYARATSSARLKLQTGDAAEAAEDAAERRRSRSRSRERNGRTRSRAGGDRGGGGGGGGGGGEDDEQRQRLRNESRARRSRSRSRAARDGGGSGGGGGGGASGDVPAYMRPTAARRAKSRGPGSRGRAPSSSSGRDSRYWPGFEESESAAATTYATPETSFDRAAARSRSAGPGGRRRKTYNDHVKESRKGRSNSRATGDSRLERREDELRSLQRRKARRRAGAGAGEDHGGAGAGPGGDDEEDEDDAARRREVAAVAAARLLPGDGARDEEHGEAELRRRARPGHGRQPSYARPTVAAARRLARMEDGDEYLSEDDEDRVDPRAREVLLQQRDRGMSSTARTPRSRSAAQTPRSRRYSVDSAGSASPGPEADLGEIQSNIDAIRRGLADATEPGHGSIEPGAARRSRSRQRLPDSARRSRSRSRSRDPYIQAAAGRRESLHEMEERAAAKMEESAEERMRRAEVERLRKMDKERRLHERRSREERKRQKAIAAEKRAMEEQIRAQYEDNLRQRQRRVEANRHKVERDRNDDLQRRKRERERAARAMRKRKEEEETAALRAAELELKAKEVEIQRKRDELEKRKRQATERKRRQNEAKFSQFRRRRMTIEDEAESSHHEHEEALREKGML